MLTAADALFAGAASPRTVTMDAIAAAADVGKGTLFRAFGSRDGLLDALWAAKLAALHAAFAAGKPPFEPETLPAERAVAFLDALLRFKLENRHLIRAREVATGGVRQSEHYRRMHHVLQTLIEEARPSPTSPDAGYAAHVLLGALHIELVEELLAAGRPLDAVREAQAACVRAVIDGVMPRD